METSPCIFWRSYIAWVIPCGKTHPNVGGSVNDLRSLTQGESKRSINIHFSLLPACGGIEASSFKIPLQCLLHQGEWASSSHEPKETFLSMSCCYHSNKIMNWCRHPMDLCFRFRNRIQARRPQGMPWSSMRESPGRWSHAGLCEKSCLEMVQSEWEPRLIPEGEMEA